MAKLAFTRTNPDVKEATFRAVLASFPTGLTVVTARRDGEKSVGFTANSVTSVSLNPPLILVCLAKNLYTLEVILDIQAFAVNFLERKQEAIARWFATKSAMPKFAQIAHRHTRLMLPILDGVLAYAECDLEQVLEAGDHFMILGRIVDGAAFDGVPLMYFRSRYRSWPVTEPRPNGSEQ